MLCGVRWTRERRIIVDSIAKRLWNSSPASLVRALERRRERRQWQPGWFTVKSGPAAGTQLFLPHASTGGWLEMVQGRFDLFLYEALQGRFSLKGALCWDIGAHFGYHSFGFASQGARVLAFEPNAYNAARLKMNLEKNPALAKNIRHLAVAVGDRDGEMVFVQSAELEGASSGSHLQEATPPLGDNAYAGFEKLSIPVSRMDTLLDRGEAPPDLIKIDIEGAEFLALQGGRRLLSTRRPLILMEVHHIRLMLHIQRFFDELNYETRILDEENATPSRCFIMATPVAKA